MKSWAEKVATEYHRHFTGKVQVVPKCAITSYDDFAIYYTPGVAEPCREIVKDIEQVYELTNRANMVAVVSDGTRVLGLGDIGPEAALPVMEGKAILFKYLGGVDAFPICLATKKEDELVTAVKWLEPSFGGINLEDIEKPKCFRVLERLRKEMGIPVWHDDQQGTATVTLAGVMGALKVVRKKIDEIRVSMIGAGAANIYIARLLIAAGVKAGNIIMVDSKGILHPDRVDLKEKEPEKWEMCLLTNAERRKGGIPEAMEGTDICIAMSRSRRPDEPPVIAPEWIKRMAEDPIVFACANPTPEIFPHEAEEAGARIVATGRSDFKNQVNNSLGFPGIFRGTLDVRAKTITDEMCIAAATALANFAERKGLSEDYIIPTMDEWEVYVDEAVAVGMKAIEQGVAGKEMTEEQLRAKAFETIKTAREIVHTLMAAGYIPAPPEV
jgi:malate dehydrogenase (oxaloacetate-decarboxylating)